MRTITFEESDCDSKMIIEIYDFFDLIGREDLTSKMFTRHDRVLVMRRIKEDGTEQRTEQIKLKTEIKILLMEYINDSMIF